jgi:hypothetical protein
MAKWKIELRNARGDRNAGTVLVDARSLAKAQRHAVRMCRRHLAACNDIYLEARGGNTYGILLGPDEVGEATITQLAPRWLTTSRARSADDRVAV